MFKGLRAQGLGLGWVVHLLRKAYLLAKKEEGKRDRDREREREIYIYTYVYMYRGPSKSL